MSRTGPWRRDFPGPLQALQGELGRLIDEYWAPGRSGPSPEEGEGAGWSPPVDLVETAEAYIVTVEVPGVPAETIDLSVKGLTLTIRGDKPADETMPPAALGERRYGPFQREVVLPGDFDFEAVRAEARLGVLFINLPRREAARRTIPVQSG